MKALTSFGSGKTIYFKSFDLDDPSANTAPIDSNGSVGNDNRGGSGTSQQFGILSAVGGNGTTNTVSAATDANGLASADLTLTVQPGDNFMVAASHDQTFLNGLTVNGITLRDSSGNTVGTATAKAKASPMLTVWRRLHLEVDSMEAVPTTGSQKNSITGKVTSINGTSSIATTVFIDQNLNDGSPKLDDAAPNTGNGRFENGRIRIGTLNVTETSDLEGNGTDFVQKNTGNGIVIPCTISKTGETDVTGTVISLLSNVVKFSISGGSLTTNFTGGSITIGGVSMSITAVNVADSSVTIAALADIPVALLDDDANGLPQLPDTSLMDVKYAPAYILSVVDGGGTNANNKQTVAFTLNLQSNTTTQINTAITVTNALESDGNRADSFWIAYVLGAFQGSPFVVGARGDNDANAEDALGGITSGTLLGSIVFIEELRDEEQESSITETAATTAHEVAHQFGLADCGDASNPCAATIHDLMGTDFYQSDSRFSDADLNRLRSRIKSPGRP